LTREQEFDLSFAVINTLLTENRAPNTFIRSYD